MVVIEALYFGKFMDYLLMKQNHERALVILMLDGPFDENREFIIDYNEVFLSTLTVPLYNLRPSTPSYKKLENHQHVVLIDDEQAWNHVTVKIKKINPREVRHSQNRFNGIRKQVQNISVCFSWLISNMKKK